jgi:hypothetical protein
MSLNCRVRARSMANRAERGQIGSNMTESGLDEPENEV